MDNKLECIDNSLEELELGETDQSLVLFISIFICWDVGDVSLVLWRLEGDRNDVFTNSLMDATI